MLPEVKNEESVLDVAKRLAAILNGLLRSGDWQNSLFLKAHAKRIAALHEQVTQFCDVVEHGSKVDDNLASANDQDSAILYIALYQVDDANLDGWLSNIRTLNEHLVTRPVYKDEQHVKELIRSKTENLERNGYLKVKVNNSDYTLADGQLDSFGHQLYLLKDDAIKLANIIEFVHGNKKLYAFRNNELVLLDEVK